MNSLLIKRPVAYFIDFMIIWCACMLPQLFAYRLFDGVPFKYFTNTYHIYFGGLLTVSLPIWLYFITQEMSHKQSTIGKRLMHLKVADYNTKKISKRKSFVRTFIKLLPWEIAHLGLIPIYFSKDPHINIGLYIANGFILIYLVFLFLKGGKQPFMILFQEQ